VQVSFQEESTNGRYLVYNGISLYITPCNMAEMRDDCAVDMRRMRRQLKEALPELQRRTTVNT
jgi:hypothetical protein